MNSPPVSVGSLRGTPTRIRGVEYARCTMLATARQIDEAAARRTLREQIARLEHELATALATTYPHVTAPRPVAHGGPRLLDLEKLEETRDALAGRLADVHLRVAEQ